MKRSAMLTTQELNFHHLRYFWTVVREGSVTAAAERLGVGQPVVSVQLKRLERQLKKPLFEKVGRGLKLTEFGQLVYDYSEDIFRLAHELCGSVTENSPRNRSRRLTVGVANALPKLIVYKLLEPVYSLSEPVQLTCEEDRPEALLGELAKGNLDLVLTDSSDVLNPRIKVYRHELGECGVTFFAAASLARRLRNDFPASLHGTPMLLQTLDSSLRRALDAWFVQQKIQPDVRGEFADSALLKVFGKAGRGVFASPSAIDAEVMSQFDVQVVGRIDAIRERFYAITGERKLTHPAIVAIHNAARQELLRSS
jgi:LysR family transcriptional regulator, transcriptional activator of nhaA